MKVKFKLKLKKYYFLKFAWQRDFFLPVFFHFLTSIFSLLVIANAKSWEVVPNENV